MGVEPTDPVTLAIVLLLMLAIASLACRIPARPAIRINPVTALRQE
jgi:ABC-type lipoprotein release transport system permease subunit